MYINRGNAYVIKRDYDRAISDYSLAIELHPLERDDEGLAYYNRTSVYILNGDNDKAIADYKKALEFRLTPQQLAVAHHNLRQLGVKP